MYAWDVGVARQKVEFDTELPPQSRLMVQPPHDLEPGASCFYHYTWASIYQLEGKEVWRFEKREYVKKEDEMKVGEGCGWPGVSRGRGRRRGVPAATSAACKQT
jgi:hypothetical protein